MGAFWELFGHLGGTLGHLGQPWESFGVTWEPFGRTFSEDLASLDALGLKIVPGLPPNTFFCVFLLSFRGFLMIFEDLFRSNVGILA